MSYLFIRILASFDSIKPSDTMKDALFTGYSRGTGSSSVSVFRTEANSTSMNNIAQNVSEFGTHVIATYVKPAYGFLVSFRILFTITRCFVISTSRQTKKLKGRRFFFFLLSTIHHPSVTLFFLRPQSKT